MIRYMTLLDNANCMRVENVQKEREYSMRWRIAFKKEVKVLADETYIRIIDRESTNGLPDDQDPFDFFHQIIKKDALDAAAFD